jgi:hypothetical protein
MTEPESVRDVVDELSTTVQTIANLMDVCVHDDFRERDLEARARSVELANMALALLERALETPFQLSPSELIGLLRTTTVLVRELRDRTIDVVVASTAVPEFPDTDDRPPA